MKKRISESESKKKRDTENEEKIIKDVTSSYVSGIIAKG